VPLQAGVLQDGERGIGSRAELDGKGVLDSESNGRASSGNKELKSDRV